METVKKSVVSRGWWRRGRDEWGEHRGFLRDESMYIDMILH